MGWMKCLRSHTCRSWSLCHELVHRAGKLAPERAGRYGPAVHVAMRAPEQRAQGHEVQPLCKSGACCRAPHALQMPGMGDVRVISVKLFSRSCAEICSPWTSSLRKPCQASRTPDSQMPPNASCARFGGSQEQRWTQQSMLMH